MQNREETDQFDYSEWLLGAPLIVKPWRDASNAVQGPTSRAYTWHRHRRGQLFCVTEGLIHARTEEGSWILPPSRAGWIPPEAMHTIETCTSTGGWSLLLSPELCTDLPARPCVIGLGDLLPALIGRAASWDKTEALTADREHVTAVILDEIRRSRHEPLHLPSPKDERVLKITNAILNEPGSLRSVEQWAVIGGISARTMRRLFRAETGMSFGQWRQQAQLVHAMEMLARGVSVTDVAYALGYATPSNFIAMFRRAFGDSPARYFAKQGS